MMLHRPGGRSAARAYANVGLETQVLSASPERLITLLLDGALVSINQAKLHLEAGNVAARGQAISKAIDIVDSGLKASVDREAGGQVAEYLLTTYDLVVRDLLQANLEGRADKLDTAAQVLGNVADAWRTAIDAPAASQAAAGQMGTTSAAV